ncbi:GNAT family N-acetyltransferase [Diaphorobacter caeni]|uniref:GNAT family N-acetyltransferase n=1 Tax=Diaphorobacter caeni TaxID=2784387 RepID=UPI00188E6F24|nr:GNAT family N-acetyltransferase [Diaphorobacter caeni]MBF5003692.1 N-acetyltransferase [Diaphorobacter caeni]
MLNIRASRENDIPTITSIYRHHVLHGTGTFEIDPPTEADMTQRRADVLGKGLPWLVAENSDTQEIVGYAYCNWFKPRPAYRFSAEDSIYVADSARGQGVGRQLLDALSVAAEQAGVRRLLAVIGDSANAGSIGVHAAAGFSHAGVLRSTGWKFGQWLDIVLMDKPLGDGDTTAPE